MTKQNATTILHRRRQNVSLIDTTMYNYVIVQHS